ncbi:unnamed protein product, partial [Owenia fusiformis]
THINNKMIAPIAFIIFASSMQGEVETVDADVCTKATIKTFEDKLDVKLNNLHDLISSKNDSIQKSNKDIQDLNIIVEDLKTKYDNLLSELQKMTECRIPWP